MSNIYNRRLDYQVDPKGKPFLQQQKTTVYPEYAVVGNTKPNLDYKTNRMLQPLFQTKKPIPQGPFNPKQPINAHGLGGRNPYYINYVSQPMASFKTRPPKALIWEPNSIREVRQNVYPDGVPKNFSQLQQADSQYLENLNNEKKQKQLESIYQERRKAGGHDGSRPHPTPSIEEELKRLDNMIAETKYGKGPYKNIGLTTEQHRQMAEKQAAEIRDELSKLNAAQGEEPAVALDEKTFEETKDDPKKLDSFYKDFLSKKEAIPTAQGSDEAIRTRTLMILGYLQSQGYDPTAADIVEQAKEWATVRTGGLGFRIKLQKPFETRIDDLVSKRKIPFAKIAPKIVKGGGKK